MILQTTKQKKLEQENNQQYNHNQMEAYYHNFLFVEKKNISNQGTQLKCIS